MDGRTNYLLIRCHSKPRISQERRMSGSVSQLCRTKLMIKVDKSLVSFLFKTIFATHFSRLTKVCSQQKLCLHWNRWPTLWLWLSLTLCLSFWTCFGSFRSTFPLLTRMRGIVLSWRWGDECQRVLNTSHFVAFCSVLWRSPPRHCQCGVWCVRLSFSHILTVLEPTDLS